MVVYLYVQLLCKFGGSIHNSHEVTSMAIKMSFYPVCNIFRDNAILRLSRKIGESAQNSVDFYQIDESIWPITSMTMKFNLAHSRDNAMLLFKFRKSAPNTYYVNKLI